MKCYDGHRTVERGFRTKRVNEIVALRRRRYHKINKGTEGAGMALPPYIVILGNVGKLRRGNYIVIIHIAKLALKRSRTKD